MAINQELKFSVLVLTEKCGIHRQAMDQLLLANQRGDSNPFNRQLFFFMTMLNVLYPDMEKLSSSLAVLVEIFEEVAEISRKVCRCFVIILAEYDIECKT